MDYIVEGGFTCDKQSKDDFIASTTAYWSEQAPQYTLSWYGADVYEGEINLTELGKESDQSRLDLAMVASNDNYSITYVFELKERWNQYTSTYYGNEPEEGCTPTYHNEGWVYNMEKDSVLSLASTQGFVPIYVNLYPDGVIRVWNINKINKTEMGYVEKDIKRRNVEVDSPKVKQGRYTLMNKQGKTYKRVCKKD